MMASRGMGAISPKKMPGPKRKQRRDDTAFYEYAEGGMTARSVKNLRNTPPADAVDNPEGLAGQYSTLRNADLAPLRKKLQSTGAARALQDLAEEQKLRQRLQGYVQGGEVKSKVNEAGNYTKPGMRKALFNKIKGQATQGTAAGQWSARKAQLLAKQYKAKGGGYRG
jgi:hypothetical protein